MNSFGTWSRSDEIDLGDERLAGPFLPGPRRVQHLLKADGSLVRRLGQFAEADVLNDDVDLVAEGFVRNVSSPRLCSFWAIVASARAGSRKNRESGYSRCTVARRRLKCFTMNCVRKYRSSGACGW